MSNSSNKAVGAAPSSNELGLQRTRLAFDRTMMAWIRTSVSLISFGFSIDKFFDFLHEKSAPNTIIGPRLFAIIMIGIGLFALAAAVVEHWWNCHILKVPGVSRLSLSTIIAGMVAGLGVLALVAVVLRR